MINNSISSFTIRLFLILYITHLNISCQGSNDNIQEKPPIKTNKLIEEVSFLFMGDFMMHGPQIQAAKDSNDNYCKFHILINYFENTSRNTSGFFHDSSSKNIY